MRSFDVSNDRLGVLHGLTQDSASQPTRHLADPEIPRPSPYRPPNGDEGESSHAAAAAHNLEKPASRSKNKFRFKKKHRTASEKDEKRDRHHRHHHHSSTHMSKRRRYTDPQNEVKDDPTAYDDTYIPNAASFKYTNPDDAFRESLFDAMADDEGAAFWENIYGQPITGYTRPEVIDERGELEMMDDEQYAKYVRNRMWEKSHQHIIEEREKREQERKKSKERKKRDQEDRERWEQADKKRMREDKHRRERKTKDRLRKRWDEYTETWAFIMGGNRADADDSGGKERRTWNQIPWPVESGELSDISREAVKQFFLLAPPSTESGDRGLVDILKLERVRWHPDKAQQRWGKGGIGEEELKGITSVFQVIDSLWIEHREKNARQA